MGTLYLVDGDDLTYEANQIRAKTGGSNPIEFAAGKGFGDVIAAIPSGGSGPQWELIGQKTYEFQEYTDTSTWQVTDTGIAINGTDYAWIITVITCDSAITTNTEWGMTIAFGGRYKSNGSYQHVATMQQKGSATLSFAAMVTHTLGLGAYGVSVNNNTNNIIFARKCHATGCPKIRAGNYIVKVYGLKSL